MLSMLLGTSSGTLLKLSKRIRLVDLEDYSDVSRVMLMVSGTDDG